MANPFSAVSLPSRTRYGNLFIERCLERHRFENNGAAPDEINPRETRTRLPSEGEGLYLCYWLADDELSWANVDLSCETKRIDFSGCEIFADSPKGFFRGPFLQVHFGPQKKEGKGYSYNDEETQNPFCEAVLHTKKEVYQFDHVVRSEDEDDKFGRVDKLYPWIRIPDSINPSIDHNLFNPHTMFRHGGDSGADVWTTDRRDLIDIVWPKLDRLARETNDRPIPKYQMILDPNQFVRNDQWVPCEFDVASDGCSVELVGGERGYYMKPELVKAVSEPILQASLPLLSKLERPKLLLEGQRLQVVVKAQKIILPAAISEEGGLSDYVGLWHVDGLNEHVAAVVLFYYRVASELSGGSMEFLHRKPVSVTHSDDDGNPEDRWVLCEKLLDGDHARCVVPIQEGTLLVFSNYQMAHRVLKMINRSTTTEASRDFVALFVIDPAAKPLVPARCHLAESYIYKKTLLGIGSIVSSEGQWTLPARLADSILEYAGIQPCVKERRRNRNQLLRAQLKPSGEIGLNSRYLVSTGNGCFTMIGWLDSMLATETEDSRKPEHLRVSGLNRSPTAVDRGLSEAFEVSSSQLCRELYPKAHFGFSCSLCQHEHPIVSPVRYHCLAPECSNNEYVLCQRCMDSNQQFKWHSHRFIACYPPSLEEEPMNSLTWGERQPSVGHGVIIEVPEAKAHTVQRGRL